MARAAIDIPADYREGVRLARDRETGQLARFVLTEMLGNWDIATAERRPMCADTGLPRYYVRLGNEAVVEGGFVALERALRRATAEATASDPAAPQPRAPADPRGPEQQRGRARARGHATRSSPARDWIDVTAVHKGGLFGSDYRMLFPGDGIPGIKRFFVDTLVVGQARPRLPAGDRRRRHRRAPRTRASASARRRRACASSAAATPTPSPPRSRRS